MSSNRLMYDTCEYQTKLNESANTLNYTLNPMRNENCNKCRMELGTVGGANVSHIKGNLVDLETDLLGITRKASLCPTKKFTSNCALGNMANCQPEPIQIQGENCNEKRVIDTTPVHLKACNMVRYPSIPMPPKPDYSNCFN